MQFEQILGPGDGIAQDLVGLVDVGGLLHRQPAFQIPGRRETIRVHMVLKLTISQAQQLPRDSVLHRKTEECKIIIGNTLHLRDLLAANRLTSTLGRRPMIASSAESPWVNLRH